ncbi:uncharacterized protein LOC143053547 isoform X2 [Mytilus galloprovincialis]|uniref:uncharacterized protein LOC143053547 isoform X2 n=1 Tax=Mytilus galloprovincialis TaxID=29158 RepID=UPI003F7B9770
MNLFASVFVYLVLVVPNSLLVFDLKCSHRSHWIQRAKDICERNDFYHCLYDTITKSWREKCFKPDDLPPGYHGVISGRLHVEKCEEKQFSPHTSWSNDGYECQYKKSICSEEGQIVVDNGSNTKDVKCRCDYRNGYAYTIKPKNECMCSPSVEDCSCHLIHCQDNIAMLSQDYVCLTQEKKSTVTKCQMIENEGKTDSNEDMKTETSVISFTDLHPRKCHLVCSLVVVACIIGICYICIVGYMPMESKSGEEPNYLCFPF